MNFKVDKIVNMELTEFQQAAKSLFLRKIEIKKANEALFIMPPGTGKTIVLIAAVLEAISTNLIKRALIIVPAKILKDFLFQTFIQRGGDQSNVEFMTVNGALKLIKEGKLASKDFDLIAFDEVNSVTPSVVEIFNFFEAFKWGLSASESESTLSLFKRNNLDIDFKLSYNAITKEFTYNNNANKGIYREVLIANIKLSLSKSGFDKISNEFYTQEYLEILEYIINEEISIVGLKELVYKKKQLELLSRLLTDDKFFDEHRLVHTKSEAVWQNFFENNTWIFGLSFNFLFNSPLEGKKLEQVVEGYSIKGSGKRVDALMKTRGLISSLCFAEIKTHKKDLLKDIHTPYRSEAWAISEELAGAIAQVQKTIHKSISNINNSLKLKDTDGFVTGENLYLIKPKSFLLIGTLGEFKNAEGYIQEEKFVSFEIFRRSVTDLEIITFDELYERAVAVIG